MTEMTTPTTPAAARVAFERDAEPMGFDLRRHECMVPEPWSEYHDINTGHRWGGYLAATHAAAARESALIADYQRLMDKHNALHVNAQAVRVERDALLIAGDDLANCAYNLAQRSGEVLSARSAVALDNARRKWDAALAAPAVEGV